MDNKFEEKISQIAEGLGYNYEPNKKSARYLLTGKGFTRIAIYKPYGNKRYQITALMPDNPYTHVQPYSQGFFDIEGRTVNSLVNSIKSRLLGGYSEAVSSAIKERVKEKNRITEAQRKIDLVRDCVTKIDSNYKFNRDSFYQYTAVGSIDVKDKISYGGALNYYDLSIKGAPDTLILEIIATIKKYKENLNNSGK